MWTISPWRTPIRASRSRTKYGRLHRDVAGSQRQRTQHNQDGRSSRTLPRSRLSERGDLCPEWKHSFSDRNRKSRCLIETYRRNNSPILRIRHGRHHQKIRRNAKRYPEKPFLEREEHRLLEAARYFSLGNRAKRLHEKLETLATGLDQFYPASHEIYLYCPSGYGRTKLSNNAIEKALSVKATTRNWKTTNTLFEMVSKL